MNNLQWILEPATQATDEEGQIYASVIAKRPDRYVAIYLGAEQGEDGRFRNVPMYCVKIKGEKDFVSRVWNEDAAREFPRAAKWWDANSDKPPTVDVRLLPGITPADLAELDTLEIRDVGALSNADVPDHLSHWKEIAVRLRSIAKPRVKLEAVPC